MLVVRDGRMRRACDHWVGHLQRVIHWESVKVRTHQWASAKDVVLYPAQA